MTSKLVPAAVAATLALTLVPASARPGGANEAPAPTPAVRFGTWGIDLAGMDRSVRPGEDFFRFVNGKWAETTPIPPDKTRYGAFEVLRDLSEVRVREILDRWAADPSLAPGSDEAKVAATYRTFLDEKKAEELDRRPIDARLAEIRGARTHDDVARLMARTSFGLGRSLFGPAVFDDQKNPDRYALYLSQAGLGLADREFYLRDAFKPQKERYQKYVADTLRLAGWAEPEANAAAVVALETRIAEAHWTRAESRNRDKTYNPMTVAELEAVAPGFPWRLWFAEAGLGGAERAVVRQDTAFPELAKIFAETPVETLKAWQAFHLADDAAPLLSKRSRRPSLGVPPEVPERGAGAAAALEARGRLRGGGDGRGDRPDLRGGVLPRGVEGEDGEAGRRPPRGDEGPHREARVDGAGDEGEGAREAVEVRREDRLPVEVARLLEARGPRGRPRRQRRARREVRLGLRREPRSASRSTRTSGA